MWLDSLIADIEESPNHEGFELWLTSPSTSPLTAPSGYISRLQYQIAGRL